LPVPVPVPLTVNGPSDADASSPAVTASSGSGSATYGAPSIPSSACDVWSAGCLLFELLTGSYLFHDDDWARFYITVTGDDPSKGLLATQAAASEGAAPPSPAPASPVSSAAASASGSSGCLPLPPLPLIDKEHEDLLRLAVGEEAAPAIITLLQTALARDAFKRPSTSTLLRSVEKILKPQPRIPTLALRT
jgi:serine/threonine protein kinase